MSCAPASTMASARRFTLTSRSNRTVAVADRKKSRYSNACYRSASRSFIPIRCERLRRPSAPKPKPAKSEDATEPSSGRSCGLTARARCVETKRVWFATDRGQSAAPDCVERGADVCVARRKALAALMPPPRVPLSRWLEGYLMLVSQAGSPPCVSFLASCQPRS